MEVNIKGNTHRNRKPLFALVAGIILAAIAGTSAIYLENVVFNNKFQLDAEEIEHTETFTSPDDWVPCEETPKTVVTTNKSNHPVKVRLNYDEWWRNQTDTENLPVEQDGHRLTTINFQNEDDWELSGNWYYWKGELAPGESTRSLFKSVTFDCSANFAVQHICTDQGCTDVHSPYEGADYHILITVQTTDEDFPHDETFSVSIDPNGGEFNGSTDVYTDTVQYGTVIDLSNINYTDHELVDWTKNGSESYTDNRIRIINDTTLVANWQSSIFHTITVNPNGGSLDGNTEPIETNVRQGESFTLTDSIPTLEGYVFNHWDIKVGDGETAPISDYTFTVSDDVTITATYDKAIAKNTRTNKEYASIAAAISDNTLQAGDTILLLADTEETVTIPEGKDFTLDLGEFIVTGSITNNGTLTLLNGEINNPDGAAFVNNGTLTMGINDYLDAEEQRVNIQDDYVRLIGTTTGIDQNGIFNYYDGYIEGEVALEGGYNAAPSYRNTFDGVVVYYFPLVDFNNVKQLQHVSLASSDNAVSKTTVNGDIYYYNLQDNINTSIRTGYKIYIVRDFDAGYTITSPVDTDVTIDLAGYDISLNDTITVNGRLAIEDSKTIVETVDNADNTYTKPSINDNVAITPHGDTANVATYGGKISTPQTIMNYGTLVLDKVFITGSSSNNTIDDSGTLIMTNAILGAESSHVIVPKSGVTYDLDDNSYFASFKISYGVIWNTLDDFVWDGGNIYGRGQGIESPNGTPHTTVKNATITIEGPSSGSYRGWYEGINQGVITVENTIISVTTGDTTCSQAQNDRNGWGCVWGIRGETVNISNSTIKVDSYGMNFGVRGSVTLGDNAIIDVKSSNSMARGVLDGIEINSNAKITATTTGSSGTAIAINKFATINNKDAIISAYSNRTRAYGIFPDTTQNVIFKNGTINANGGVSAYGIYGVARNVSVEGGEINTQSASGVSSGVYMSYSSCALNIDNVKISSKTTSGSAYGIYIDNASSASIKNGKIEGDTHGIYVNGNYYVTLGANDDELGIESPEIIGGKYGLYGGKYNFYDGVLRGGTNAYQEGVIKAVPDATTYHFERALGPEDAPDTPEDERTGQESCWLVPADNYLEVGGVGYNSLGKAYDAITGNSGTIKVIKDTTIEAALPESPSGKEITFDLNGHKLTYTQSLINNSTMTIVDSSADKTGILHNSNTGVNTITNNATLTVDSVHITAVTRPIYTAKGSTLNVVSSLIESDDSGIYGDGTSSEPAHITVNGTTINVVHVGIEQPNSILDIRNSDITVTGPESGSHRGWYEGINQGTSTIDNVNITVTTGDTLCAIPTTRIEDNGCVWGVSSSATISNSTIKVESYDMNFGVRGGVTFNENVTVETINSKNYSRGVMDGATINSNTKISATSRGGYPAIGIVGGSSITATINNEDAVITATSSGRAYGIHQRSYGPVTINSGTVNAIGAYANAVYAPSEGAVNITGGHLNTHSTNSESYGVVITNANRGTLSMSGGEIISESDSGVSCGIYVEAAKNATVSGGEIYGEDYGICANGSYYVTLGANDDELGIESPEIIGGKYGLYGGKYNFYDGVLRGGTNAYQEGVIKAVPDATTYHFERALGPEDAPDTPEDERTGQESCWLVPADNYLEVGGVGYNSLGKAYDAITGNSGTIKVIKDTTIEAALPESPSGKEITFDLNGHKLTYTQSLINNSTMTIVDSSADKTGILHNSNTGVNTITNNATLTVDSVHITAVTRPIYTAKGSTLNVVSSLIESDDSGIYGDGTSSEPAHITVNGTTINVVHVGIEQPNSILDIRNSDITVTGPESGSHRGWYEGINQGTSTIDNVNITVTTGDTSCSTSSSQLSDWGCAWGVRGDTTISNTTIKVKSYGMNFGVRGGATLNNNVVIETESSNNMTRGVMDGANIEGNVTITATATGRDIAVGILGGYYLTATINNEDAAITASSKNRAYGIYQASSSPITINAGTINATGDSSAYGLYVPYQKAIISGGKINAHSSTEQSYGVYMSNASYGILNMTGGEIASETDSGVAYGIYVNAAAESTITGGRIYGGDYGVFTNSGYYTTVGTNDGGLNSESPEIIGGKYGLYGGRYNFYDGVLKGGILGYQDGYVKEIPENTALHIEQQTIDGADYDARWLVYEYDVAQINDVKYTSLSKAIAAANTGDEIQLIANNFISTPLTISSDKEFIIKTNGYDIIIIGNPIVNNGKVTIINNHSSQSPIIDYYYTGDYLITNETGAELSLQNIRLSSSKTIDNKGTLTLDNVSSVATDININNIGNIVAANNMTLSGTNYPIYNNGGNVSISNATITGGEVYNNAGELSISNSSAARTGANIFNFIINKGTLSLNAFDATMTNTKLESGGSDNYARAIYNTGHITTSNGTVIRNIINAGASEYIRKYSVVSYNDGGTIDSSETSYILDSSNTRRTELDVYAVYNPTGSFKLESGSISVTGKFYSSAAAYGIYNGSGVVTIGIPESPDSEHYGKADANVSLTDPNIYVVSDESAGVGVKNASGGKIYYYDGRITGSTAAMQEKPAGVEYLYEPKDYVDENGYHYRVLEWMREQPGS